MADDKKMSKLAMISTGLGAISVGNGLIKQAKDWHRERYLYTATLNSDAFVYNEVKALLNEQATTRSYKFVAHRTGVNRHYNSDSDAIIFIDGHKIVVALNKPDIETPNPVYTQNESLHFSSKTAEGMDALENLISELIEKKRIKQKAVMIGSPTKYGDWDYNSIPKKRLDSVFLPEGVRESLMSDVEHFLASEEQFLKVGIPWHRGYCFYGEPGNGKSSIALALANHYGLDLHNLPLSMMGDDKTLAKCITEIKDQSILLLEDIDIFSNTMGREQKSDSPTLAGLLNMLDGVATPHGLLTIMTTNHINNLDKALIRPGRMDYKLELKKPDTYQIESMFRTVFEEPVGVDRLRDFESMAAVADVFKRNLEDPEAVRLELKAS